jgi:uncharacterized protein with HEPN domain
MRDAAREAMGFAAGRGRSDLDTDRQLLLSIVKDVEIVGEAASRVGAELRSRHPELPWAAIIAMRNRLIHAYFDIDRDVVWDTVTADLPPLLAAIETILENAESRAQRNVRDFEQTARARRAKDEKSPAAASATAGLHVSTGWR